MSGICQDRRSRWQEIQKGLQFIQSTLPYPGTQEQYEVFIKDLVLNLFGEGNDVFKEGEWTKSVEMYTEALSIAEYADSEEIAVPMGLLEHLYVNRAASYLNIVPGLYDQALTDCEKALELNQGNYKAHFRKAKSLRELGRHTEAYEAVAKCSLVVPQDPSVIQLTQELAKALGLKIRKAYVRSKPALNVTPGASYSEASCDSYTHGPSSVEDIDTEVPHHGAPAVPAPVQSPLPPPLAPPRGDHALDDGRSSSSSSGSPLPLPVAELPAAFHHHHHHHQPSPAPLPPATAGPPVPPAPPPPLVNGSGAHCHAHPLLEDGQDCDAELIGDDLDALLDQARPADCSLGMSTEQGPLLLAPSVAPGSPRQRPFFMPSHIGVFSYMQQPPPPHCTVNLPPVYHQPGSSLYLGMDTLDSLSPALDTLDSLSTLSVSDYTADFPQTPFRPQVQAHAPQLNNHGNPTGMALGMPDNTVSFPAPRDLTKNPLADTHEFKQACSICFVKTGPRVMDYTLSTEEHKCKKDALLGRICYHKDRSWKLIRPRPTKNQYIGPYYICKEVAVGVDCLYPGHCTFAYCQEEIDVWTLERKGFISRELLFDPSGPSCNVKLTVAKILQEHRGIFMFLCGVCFDHKPRIISKATQDSPSCCSHPLTKHDMTEDNKCLVHILKESTVRYSKVRPLYPHCLLDLCRHEVRYGCVREDECFFAHSLVELKVWMMQHETGITGENIVQEAKKFWTTASTAQGAQPPIAQRKFGPPNLKMLFVCGQCWRNGQLNEADKNKKYCSAKARHTWSKDRRVVLVSSSERKKWTTVRALPTKKPIPTQFEICMHVTAGKKCQYIGNCSFAHGTEERDLWTYMKENNIRDMDQLYELWLMSQKPGWSEENTNGAVRENGKQIVMPTDFAEEASNHCWLCGKNCNSDKQWQQHITSEKHKDKVFNSEDDQNCWQYRFPTGTFQVCERYLKGTCPERGNCQLAHGKQELEEWRERREFLLMKLAKARKDHLIAPKDNDFGKYSFLLDIQ